MTQEDFLQNPQQRMEQLQQELKDVKISSQQTLERTVQQNTPTTKSFYQRIYKRIQQKQHAFINLLVAFLAYMLAYALHQKSKSYQTLQQQFEIEQSTTKALQQVLRSMLQDETIYRIASKTIQVLEEEKKTPTTLSSTWQWPWSSSSIRTYPTVSSQNDINHNTNRHKGEEVVATCIRSILEDLIGDVAYDSETQKQKGIEKVWKENKIHLASQRSQAQQDDDILQ